ncbi:MAG: zinc ribbon domain-containing protein [Ruminococcus sp.]|nr:zinc ribbon domain-containing protein [Ruminococcus sp.]
MPNYCSNCGAKLGQGNSFCTNCGTAIDSSQNKKNTNAGLSKDCPNCGARIKADASFCPTCFATLRNVQPGARGANLTPPAFCRSKQNGLKPGTRRTIYLIMAALALFDILFLPIFDVWGGLFPSEYNNFSDVMHYIANSSDAFDYRVVIYTVCLFIPSVLLVIAAAVNNRPFFMTSSIIGIAAWLYICIEFSNDMGIDEFFDFGEYGCISIGTWLALPIFVASIILSICLKTKKKENGYYNY